MEFYLLSAIFFPILFSPIFLLLNRFPRIRHFLGFISSGIALIALILVILAGIKSHWNVPVTWEGSWVPFLGVNMAFITDGLSLFFGLLITAVGVLINIYAQFYMEPNDPSLGRFYSCLNIFMGAMLGTVFSINLMVLFFFWELTGLISFLLIGYYYKEENVWNSAKTTMLVTSLTGLALLMGIILLGQLYGSFNWMYIVNHVEKFQSEHWIPIFTIIGFLIGIFGKSAQFPFYFWLPKAMVAPTPVSAYLHAATMVKLGIFLVARMYPLFITHPIWFPVVTSVCFVTMLIGAGLSLVSHDLKAILAYATISQLGFFIGFYGMGSEEGVQYDFVHILNHTLYKGSLFMLVGIVNHATGIRDIRRLGGLFHHLPFTTILFFIAAGAMAGLPGTVGFLSKEMMLSDVVILGRAHHSGWIILGILFTASLFKVAFSIRIFYHLFVRDLKEPISVFHRPGWAIEIAPAILSITAFVLGIWPTGLNHLVGSFYVSGLHAENPELIKIWHGWTIELLLSAVILATGTALFLLAEKTDWYWAKVPNFLRFENFYNQIIKAFQNASIVITNFIHSKRPDSQLLWFFTLLTGLVGWHLVSYFNLNSFSRSFEHFNLIRAAAGTFVILFSLCVVFLRNPLSQLIALSGSGFALTLYFVFFEAPDLAMTQILVEAVTLFLILIFFRSIHHSTQIAQENQWRRWVKAGISLGMGIFSLLTAHLYNSQERSENLKNFFLNNTIPLAHGKNAVNTILVDFRGLDTLGEISVLVIACLGAIGLLTRKLPFYFDFSGKERDAIPSIILKNTLPFIFFLVNIFAIYLLVRGHDYPGGGFAGGLCCGIAVILIGIVSHIKKKKSFGLQINPLWLTFFGLALAWTVGISSLFFGNPFLTHQFAVWRLPIGNIPFNTPLLFDIGVFFVVAGMTVKIVFFFRNYVSKEKG